MKLPSLGSPDHDKSRIPTPGKQVASADPLGPKPDLVTPTAFEPPTPQIFKTPGGITVWLVEKPSLPLVSMTLIVRAGSGQDPKGKAGLAHMTADLLDEGAGKRTAIELSDAMNDLGASFRTGATPDGSYATLTVLKKNFGKAFEVVADVVARPTLSEKEFARIADLWKNRLKKRADDPDIVASLVSSAAVFGPGTSYGHPTGGLVAEAEAVTLAEIKRFYQGAWRPEQATIVASGDITKAELTTVIEAQLASWKATGEAIALELREDDAWRAPKVILVDRPEAPQSVLSVLRRGIRASDPKAPLLDLINNALGGSFTSRLNQNLREEKNWSYGARSAFTETRGQGAFVARTSVETPVTGLALKEIFSELSAISTKGLTPEELEKVKAQDRADLVETYGTVGGIAGRMGSLVRIGLSPDFDEQASHARQRATLSQLAPLGKSHLDPDGAIVVIVGPAKDFVSAQTKEKVEGVETQLAKQGFPKPVLWTPEGVPVP